MSLVRRAATALVTLTATLAVGAVGTPTATAVVHEPPRPAFYEAPAVLPSTAALRLRMSRSKGWGCVSS